MPYGGVSDHVSTELETFYNGASQGKQTFSSVQLEKTWSRGGSTRNTYPKKGSAKRLGPPTWQTVSVLEGPRLPYRVKSKRTGKLVWAREPIKVLRLRPTKTKSCPAKGENLTPNDLAFYETKVTWLNRIGTVTESKAGQGTFTYTGDLCQPWKTRWNNVPVGVVLNPYLGNVSVQDHHPEVAEAISRLSDSALKGLYQKAKNQEINIAQFIGERKQTISMIAAAVTRIASVLSAVKRGNVRKAARTLFPDSPKKVANDVLMIQYGVRPLMSDIDGAMAFLAQSEDLVFDIHVKRTEKIPTKTSVVRKDTVWPYLPFVTTTVTWGEVTVKYKARCRVKLETVRGAARLGFENPAALAWELTPWSFVLDWALPIGDYLNYSDAFAGISLDFVTKSVFVKEGTSFTRSFNGTNPYGWSFSGPTTGFTASRVFCERTKLVSLPGLKLPKLQNPFSAEHALNAGALLVKTFVKGK